MNEIKEITKKKAEKMMNRQILDLLIDKWKRELLPRKEEWLKNGWPSKLVQTSFELNGIAYEIYPEDIGLGGDCWDAGFMESIQPDIEKDLAAYGAMHIYHFGFLD